MRYKRIKLGLFLSSLLAMANAVNIAYVPKVAPGDTATAGAGKQWPTNRFVADATGNCITDNLTGLVWAKNGNLLGTGSWGDSSTVGTAQYKVAQMNTNSSATGYKLCGYSDWRLPNINELLSLVNYAQTDNANWLNSQGFNNVKSSRYWTSNNIKTMQQPWFIELGTYSHFSLLDADDNSKAYYVWPVRGGK